MKRADDSGDTTVTIPGARLNDETRQMLLSLSPCWATEEKKTNKKGEGECVCSTFSLPNAGRRYTR